jgi:UDP-N-acetylglucosamine 4,6-dehydratase
MKKVLITGGAGTIGKAFIKRYKSYEIGKQDKFKFYNMSRNEASQAQLKREFPYIENHIGCIEDIGSVYRVFDKVRPDIVIHTAAMKHIDIIEHEPIQACNINVVGSLNIISASIKYNVPITVAVSTDKACSSESVYGDTKHLMERCFMDANGEDIRFSCCRFANVAHSNGSVLPFWLGLKEKGLPLKLTDPKMNRLIFTQKDAAELIMKTITYTETYGGGFVGSTKMKTTNMLDLAKVISKDIEIVGKRAGEKVDEDLISEKELPYTYVRGDYIMIREEENCGKISCGLLNRLEHPYNSSTADVMTKDEMKKLIEDVE